MTKQTNYSKTPTGRLKELYSRLEDIRASLDEAGVSYEAKSTQGEVIPKLHPLWVAYKDIHSEIRMIETEEGKTALGKERKRKLSAEAKKLSAEAQAVGGGDSKDDILDFLE